MNRRREIAGLLILSCFLSGCSILPGKLEKNGQDVWAQLPQKELEAPAAPAGDSKAGEILNATLYYPSADGTLLMPVSRTLWLTGSQRAEERIAEELLKSPAGADVLPAAPDNMTLAWAAPYSNVLTLNFGLPGDLPDDETLIRFLSALGATFGGGRYVNALINGNPLSVFGIPAGAVGESEADLARLRKPATGEDTHFARNVCVYCPSSCGRFVVPEIRRVEFDADTVLKSLIEQLIKTPESEDLLPGIPLSEGAFEREPGVEEADDQKKIVNLYFTMEAYEALEASAEERWQFLASAVLTLSEFLPDFAGMRVYIAGHLVTEVPKENGEMLKFDAGIIRRSDFSGQTGELVPLYFTDGSGMLASEMRATGCADFGSIRARVAMLMDGARGNGLTSTFPDGLVPADLLGATVKDNVALLNFSSEFYRLTQALDADGERMLVYSLVNTLTELSGVRAVRIYIEGETVDTLAGGICLYGVLLPNPGLCARTQTAEQ